MADDWIPSELIGQQPKTREEDTWKPKELVQPEIPTKHGRNIPRQNALNKPVQSVPDVEKDETGWAPMEVLKTASSIVNPASSGFAKNVTKKAVERAADLGGGILSAVGEAGDTLQQAFPLPSVIWDDKGLRTVSGVEYNALRDMGVVDEGFNAIGEKLKGVDFGYVERHGPESIKKKYREFDLDEDSILTSMGKAADLGWEAVLYGGEQGIGSLPDMVAVSYVMPAYIISFADLMGDERARNEGRAEGTLEDTAKALPFAAGSALLERFGVKGITGAGKVAAENVGRELLNAGWKKVVSTVGKEAMKAGVKSGWREGWTEFFQEGMIEYVGETWGTDKALEFKEGLERGAWGALGGAIPGFGGGAVVSTGRNIQGKHKIDTMYQDIVREAKQNGVYDYISQLIDNDLTLEQAKIMQEEYIDLEQQKAPIDIQDDTWTYSDPVLEADYAPNEFQQQPKFYEENQEYRDQIDEWYVPVKEQSGLTPNNLAPGQVEFFLEKPFQRDYNSAKSRLDIWEATLNELQQGNEVGTVTVEEAVQNIQDAKADLRQVEGIYNSRIEAFQRLQPMLQNLVNTYAPNMSVALVDNTNTADVSLSGAKVGIGNNHFLMKVNLGNITSEAGQQTNPDKLAAKHVDTLGHEFGHMLIHHYFGTSPTQTQEAMYAEYRNYLRKIRDATNIEEFYKAARGPIGTNSWITLQQRRGLYPGDVGVARNPAEFNSWLQRQKMDMAYTADGERRAWLPYALSFDEFAAVRIANALTEEGTSLQKLGGAPLARIKTLLERFWRRFSKEHGSEVGIKTFLNEIKSTASTKAVESKLAELGLSPQEIEARTFDPVKRLDKVLAGVAAPPLTAKRMGESIDRYNKLIKYGYTLLQLAEENQHIEGLQNYVLGVRNWANTKSAWANQANEALKAWTKLGKDQATRLGKFLYAAANLSDKEGRALTPEELMQLNNTKAHQLEPETLQVFENVQQMYHEAIGFDPANPRGLYKVLLDDLARSYAENPSAYEAQKTILDREMRQLQDRTFMPYSRFGEYTVRVKALHNAEFGKGEQYKIGDIIRFETYQTEKEANQAYAQAKREFPGHQVGAGKLEESSFAFQGMPPQLLQQLKKSLPDLTAEQKETIDGLIYKYAPSQSYKKHLQRRKGTKGYSMDAMRTFADYFQHFSNHLARIQHSEQMDEAINQVSLRGEQIRKLGGNAIKNDQIRNHMLTHKQYIMNPENELANLRALGFLWHLGFNIKSAWVNWFQVPMMTYSYLAARKEIGGGVGKGDVRATAELSKAYKDVMVEITKGNHLGVFEREMMDILKADGIINESLATELAATAEGSVLSRVLPGSFMNSQQAGYQIRQVSHAAAIPFQMVEQYNRRISALAAYRMAVKEGLSHQTAIQEAHRAVDKTQFEYAKWNRPRFMRGKKSVLFLFFSYLQNALHFALKDPGRARFIIMLGAMTGLSGLPGAEDIMDLVDMMGNWYNKKFGKSGKKFDVRHEIRELVKELDGNPDLVMHGLGRTYGLGPLHAMELAGLPVPNVDIGGSLSLGRVVPGLEQVVSPRRDPNATVGAAAKDIGGAILAVPFGMYDALMSNSPDKWKAYEKALPAAMKSVSKAGRLAERGAETNAMNAEVVEFDVTDPRQQAELVAQSLGFRPTRLAQAQEKDYAQRETVEFYKIRRGMLLKDFAYAREIKDREGIADAKSAIKRYNNSVPYGELRISGKDMVQSMKSRRKRQMKFEHDRPEGRDYIRLHRDVGDLYPEVETEEVK